MYHEMMTITTDDIVGLSRAQQAKYADQPELSAQSDEKLAGSLLLS